MILAIIYYSLYNIEEMARWLSWLERRPVTAEVVGSSPIRVAKEDSKWSLLFLCLSKYIIYRRNSFNVVLYFVFYRAISANFMRKY